MKMNFKSDTEKKRLIKLHTPKSNVAVNCIKAAVVGGLICMGAEALRLLYIYLGMTADDAQLLTSVSIIFIGALATSLGFFDRFARHAGAGTLVPITGFSNSIVSEAIDSRSEGYILGVGTKIFTVAGPVILYATVSSVIYGAVYYIYKVVIGA